MARALRIAHCVEQYAPAIGGMPEVVKQLSERMVRMGHEVTVLTSHHAERVTDTLNGVRIRSFPISGNAVAGIRGSTAPYLQALRDGGFDVVTFFAAQQWSLDTALEHLDTIPAKKVFVPTGFSALNRPDWRSYYAAMPGYLAKMDMNVFLSDRYQDIAFARAHHTPALTVIPNGASEIEFGQRSSLDIIGELGLPKDTRIILHIGSYTGAKGHREAIAMFVKAAPKNSALVLIGKGNGVLERAFERHYSYIPLRLLSLLKGTRILFRELDRAHTVAALQHAQLFLFPSNIECSPIVLFEAMAAGLPFLSSRAGNAEEIVEWTAGGWTIPGTRDAHGLERPDIAAGAALLRSLMMDTPRMLAAGEAGHRAWRARFTWQHIAEQYMATYRSLLEPIG